jgi:isoleucyl-tRNA synthetase
VLDRYILAKTRELGRRHRGDGRVRPVRACGAIRSVPRRAQQLVHPPQPRALLGRASRTTSSDAYDTLHTVLVTLCRARAPLLPLTTEAVYRGSPASAACTSPIGPRSPAGPSIGSCVTTMDRVRDACSDRARLREAQKRLRIRLPLVR